jgi:hypothetical protein
VVSRNNHHIGFSYIRSNHFRLHGANVFVGPSSNGVVRHQLLILQLQEIKPTTLRIESNTNETTTTSLFGGNTVGTGLWTLVSGSGTIHHAKFPTSGPNLLWVMEPMYSVGPSSSKIVRHQLLIFNYKKSEPQLPATVGRDPNACESCHWWPFR